MYKLHISAFKSFKIGSNCFHDKCLTVSYIFALVKEHKNIPVTIY